MITTAEELVSMVTVVHGGDSRGALILSDEFLGIILALSDELTSLKKEVQELKGTKEHEKKI